MMLRVAACLGFLRAGEMTVPSDADYDPTIHLNYCDIAVDDSRKPTVLRVTIKQSKTDPFRREIDLFLEKTVTDLSSVKATFWLDQMGQGICLWTVFDKTTSCEQHTRGSPGSRH